MLDPQTGRVPAPNLRPERKAWRETRAPRRRKAHAGPCQRRGHHGREAQSARCVEKGVSRLESHVPSSLRRTPYVTSREGRGTKKVPASTSTMFCSAPAAVEMRSGHPKFQASLFKHGKRSSRGGSGSGCAGEALAASITTRKFKRSSSRSIQDSAALPRAERTQEENKREERSLQVTSEEKED